MLNTIKKILIKSKVYTIFMKKSGREQSDSIKSLLDSEFDYAMNVVPDSGDALYGKIRLRVHGFEKNLVKGFVPKLDSLSTLFPMTERLLNDYPEYPRSGDAIVETIGIAKSVIAANIIGGRDCRKQNSELEQFIKRNHLETISPRIINIHKVSEIGRPQDVSEQYDEFVRNRHSVREFTPEIVDEATLKEIVTTALICPSACNRQPCSVYYSDNPESVRDLLPDKSVTKDVFNLLFVTVNKSFYNVKELFQPWIDGGIFVESLIMALHSRGFGTCPFQYVKTNPNYQKLKDRIKIQANEDIVCCVGFGYLKDGYNIIETHRKEVEEMMMKF